ncbi:hypothetical protein BHE74_00013142 [Ensete ventricosum]|nr:hypothetical protein BHE74_00013142 [Ensete ventricosum]
MRYVDAISHIWRRVVIPDLSVSAARIRRATTTGATATFQSRPLGHGWDLVGRKVAYISIALAVWKSAIGSEKERGKGRRPPLLLLLLPLLSVSTACSVSWPSWKLVVVGRNRSMAVDAGAQFHVLAVDDSLMDRKLIERLLKTSSFHVRVGVSVTTVDSGSKALEVLGLREDQVTPSAVSPEHNVIFDLSAFLFLFLDVRMCMMAA